MDNANAAKTPDVLVVEDDHLLNTLVCRCVRLAGHPVRSALDGTSALEQAMEHPPRLVLLDLMLPDTTGFDVCLAIKKDERTRHATVVFVTALNDDESRRRGMECGGDAFLFKPFDPDQLINTVKKYTA